MESKRVKVKVVMLPTKGDSTFGYITEIKTYHRYTNEENSYNNLANNLAIPHHLYFISEEKLKDGEWCYESKMKGNKIFEYDSSNMWHQGAYKVVATTDKSLVYLTNNGRIEHNLPQISQEFIENYCKVGGIDEVEIEYYKYAEELSGVNLIPQDLYRIKIDSNNCVFIHPIKDSWSKEEVVKLIESAVHDFAGMNTYDDDNLNRWIKDNL